MLSIIIPTLNAGHTLPQTLGALVRGALDGLVCEVIVVDGGSIDATLSIADEAGCKIIHAPPSRGGQLCEGAEAAKGQWLLFLHADTELSPDWVEEMGQFINRYGYEKAGYARFELAAFGLRPWLLQRLVALRCALLAMPYGDQGLLISRLLYAQMGGYQPVPIMEDVALARKLGRKRLVPLRVRAVTSAARYEKRGYLRRVLRNGFCLGLYVCGVSPQRIAKVYAK